MKTKISVVILIVSLFLTVAPVSFARKTAPTDWSAVQKLAAGTDLFVKTSEGKTVRGSLLTVRDIDIELSVKGRSSTLSKNNIKAIYFAAAKSKKRGRVIGGAIGAVAGASVNRNADYESDYNYSAPVLLLFTGLTGGAFIGNLFGKGKKRGALIYQTK